MPGLWAAIAAATSLFRFLNTRNYWHAALGAGFGQPVYDDRETRGGWLTRIPDGHGFWSYVSTDSRRRVVASFNEGGWWNAGGSHGSDHSVNVEYKPAENVSLTLSPGYHPQHSNAPSVRTLDDDTPSVFSEFDSHVVDLTMRADVTLSPTRSVQLYTQPVIATGRYQGAKGSAAPGEYSFVAVDDYLANGQLTPDGRTPNFNARSLRGNLVVRWEYRRSSTLHVVWSEAREESDADGSFHLFHDLSQALTAPGSGALQVKVSDWLGR